MRREGMVVSLENGCARVKFTRESSCGKCTACDGRPCEAVADADIEVAIGDRVAVEMPDKAVLRLSVITYGVPLFALLIGLAAGYVLWQGTNVSINADLFIAIIAGVFLLLGFFALHVLQGKRSLQQYKNVRIIEIIKSYS